MIERLSKVQAAKYLGVSLSTFKKVVQKEIPVIKIGRLTQYKLSDLDAYLESKRVNIKQ